MAKNWIQEMGMKQGALHEQMGIPMGMKIPKGKLKKAAKKKGKMGARARLAMTLASFH